MSTHKLAPLRGCGKQYCVSCGQIGRVSGQCRGHRPHRVGSAAMAIAQLKHDWRENPQGFQKHYGGGGPEIRVWTGEDE